VLVHSGDRQWRLPTPPGADLLTVLRGLDGVSVPSVCGGRGTCGKCLVRLVRSERPEPAQDPETERVLACRQPADEVAEVWVAEVPPIAVLAEFAGRPWQPSEDERGEGYAVAVDVGTTTVVAALVELGSGLVVGSVSDRNDQAEFGADVISRISAEAEVGLERLTATVRGQLATMVGHLLAQAGIGPAAVRRYSVAGNTVMEHFLTGLSAKTIGQAPFTPLSLFGDERESADLGLPGSAPQDLGLPSAAPQDVGLLGAASSDSGLPGSAPVYLLPAVAGYVGGDITAGVLACGLDRPGPTALLVDLGTNGEIVLRTANGRLITCATAAGPAFEGAGIECGMAAVAGAVDKVKVAAGRVRASTILGARPIGLCGSGILDALAAAVELGLVDDTGRLLERDEVGPQMVDLLGDEDAPDRFLLTPDGEVYLSQRDLRALQLAKGAVASGIDVLLQEAGLAPEDVAEVYLAGGFGTKVRPRSLAAIGMVPEVFAERIRPVGNAALAGAVRACFASGRSRLAEVAASCEYLELSSDPRFTTVFMDLICFPPAPYQGYDAVAELAGSIGFKCVGRLDAKTLRTLPEVREMCAVDKCHQFGKNWTCPPASCSLASFAERMGSYRWGVLVQTVGQLADSFDVDAMLDAERVHKARFRQLATSLQGSFPRQFPLGAGACGLCKTCTYPDSPCKLPGIAYPSMEAAGLLVTDVCDRNGIPYYHGPLTLTYTSCILLE
jgi:uncharacterized 2Fe-2S/4Fe-4S cluster protein (DUF4445 family)/predicted metal-binding protein